MNKCYISPQATVVRMNSPLLFSQSKEIVIPAGAKGMINEDETLSYENENE